ncbi:WbuC family cupin fold metalloprotein [Arenicellales bacterium nBUS_45]
MNIDLSKQRVTSPEVIHAEDKTFALDSRDIDKLIKIATENPRERSRLCVHTYVDEVVQQMFITHKQDAYVRPHKHIKKNEAILVLSGTADYLIFSESGEIKKCVPVGDFSSGACFFVTTAKENFHTLLIRSNWLVFLEVSEGPFVGTETVFAPWAPSDADKDLVEIYMDQIDAEVKSLKS